MYYIPSNRFSSKSIVIFAFVTLLFMPLIGLAYAYATWYIPFIYANCLLTLGFGFFAGFIISEFVIKRGNVRHTRLAALLGLLAGIFALYCSWVVWIDLAMHAGKSYGTAKIGFRASNISISETINLFFQPGKVWEAAMKINKRGTWTLTGTQVKGVFLGIIWIIEALAVIITSIILPTAQAAKPYCESTNTWAKKKLLPAMSFIENSETFKTNLENRNYTDLEKLEKAPLPLNGYHSDITLYHTPSGTYFLSATNKTPKDDGKFDADILVEHITIGDVIGRKLFGME